MIRYYSNMSIVNCKELFCKFSFTGKAYQEIFPKQLGTLEIKSFRNHLKYSILGGFSAGLKGALGPTVTKKWNSSSAEMNCINR